MSAWGSQMGISVLMFVVTFPVGLWFLVYHHYHRHGSFRGWSAFLTVVSFFYFAGLVAFTLFPLPDTNSVYCVAREGTTYWQLVPFASVGDVVREAAVVGFPAVLRTGVFLQVFFNVVLLVPFGALLAYRYRKSFVFTVLAGLGVSLLIEATQGTGVWGLFSCPYRLADVDDLVTNTAGAAVGWGVGYVLSRYLPDPVGETAPDVDAPRVVRRVFAGAIDLVAFIIVGVLVQVGMNAVLYLSNGGSVPEWAATAVPLTGAALAGIVLFLVVPLIDSRGATPGQIATWLAEVDVSSGHPASNRQVAIRFAVRWLPILVTTLFQPLLALAAVVLYEAVTVLIRNDWRSLSAVLAGTTTVTRRHLDAETRRETAG